MTSTAYALTKLGEQISDSSENGNLMSLQACDRTCEKLLRILDQQGKEDFALIATLQQRLAREGAEEEAMLHVDADAASALLHTQLLRCKPQGEGSTSELTGDAKLLELQRRLHVRLEGLVGVSAACHEERVNLLSGMLNVVSSVERNSTSST